MKSKIIVLFLFTLCLFSFPTAIILGQQANLEGSWKGELKVMGQKLPLVFHFEPSSGEWKGTMDSPAQGAKGIALSKVLFTPPMVAVEVDQFKITYEGILSGDAIQGTFTQGGMEFPLDLSKVNDGEAILGPRPQEPKGPFDYDVIETAFSNSAAGITLKGTLTKPKGMGPFPAVILVSGSGKHDRDGVIFGHKPLWVMADYLTKKGIAVLRYDERGVGESEGDFSTATSWDFESDATAALDHLRKFPFVNQLRAGVIGHSEGGMIVWMMAAKEKGMNFGISLAGPVVPISELMAQQTKDVLTSSGASPDLIKKQGEVNGVIYKVFKETNDYEDLEATLSAALEEYVTQTEDSVSNEELADLKKAYGKMVNPWFFTFLKMEPEVYIEQIDIPVLALFGEKDMQINGQINYDALQRIKEENNLALISSKLYPGMNHLFQRSESGAISEYGMLEETFNEAVIEDMANWILGLE